MATHKEAFAYAGKADSLDPSSLLNLTYLGVIYVGAGNAEKLLMLGRRLLDLEPNFYGGHMWTGAGLKIQKRYKEAIAEFDLAMKLNPDYLNLSFLGVCYGAMGEKTKALETIAKMKKMKGADIVGNCFIGNVYAAAGELDIAFRYYDKAVENRESQILWAKPSFRDIQMDLKDPRVLRLFEKMGQPYL